MTKETPLNIHTKFINRFRCRDASLDEEDYKIATGQFSILGTANICINLSNEEREEFYRKIEDAYFLYALGGEMQLTQSPEDWLNKVKKAVYAKERIMFKSTITGRPAEPMVLISEHEYKETIRKRDEAERKSKEKDDIINKQQKTIALLNGDIDFKKECADNLYYAIQSIANPDYTENLHTLCERIMDIPTMAETLHEHGNHLLLNIAGVLMGETVVTGGSANQISKNICSNTSGAKYVYYYKPANKNYQRITNYQLNQLKYHIQLFKDNRL